jgi:hypothetical protein
METSGIKHIVIDIQGTKKVNIPLAVMNSIMEVTLDHRNYPILMHCNHGRVHQDLPALPSFRFVSNLLNIASNGLRSRHHSQGYGMAS